MIDLSDQRFKALQVEVDVLAEATIDTPLTSLPQWDSLAVLLVITHFEHVYHIMITGAQVRACSTPRDLIKFIPVT
jgi:acyl carrier protein